METIEMKMTSFLLSAVACAFTTFAVPEDNLLLNGTLEADQVDVPTFWRSSNIEGMTQIVTCRSSGGSTGFGRRICGAVQRLGARVPVVRRFHGSRRLPHHRP